ncbi:tetratricopeptide repeat protein [Patescibacteria group bacterium]|nr:tetratricopeptide repeat protein [Patescibacteria group bacterium]
MHEIGNYEAALAKFDAAVAASPNMKKAWYNKGLAHYHLGQPEKAMESYDKAIALDANYVDALADK